MKEQPKWDSAKHGISKLLDHKVYTIFMTIMTIYALFGDDLRVVAFPVSCDEYFYTITTICMFFFAVEIVLASIAKPDYFLGFYFWLDCIATASLIFDIGFLWDYLQS